MLNAKHLGTAVVLALASTAASAEITANGAVSNNYLWRGLTQTSDLPSISGGIDWASESGLYAGTWVSNVDYTGGNGPFSYEHDLYVGFATDSYDIGLLYYNYDEETRYDFAEIYGSVGFSGFTLGAYVLVWADERTLGTGQDYDPGTAYYLYADYGFELANGMAVGLHVGMHDGDFSDSFNFGIGDVANELDPYYDYSLSLGVGDFTFTVSDTTIGAGVGGNNSREKFVVSYGTEFGLQ